MIRLDTINRYLYVSLGGTVTTNQLPVVVSYSDKTATTYNGGSQTSLTNNTSIVTICAAPGASTTRDVDFISVWNRDTVAASVNIRFEDNGTAYQLIQTTLSAGDQLTYTHGEGWSTVDAAGNKKTAVVATKFTIQFNILAGDLNEYTLAEYATFPFNVNRAFYKTASGTITANIRKNGTSVTGLSALALTSAQSNTSATGNNTFSIGDKLTVLFSANSSATLVSLMLDCSKG